MSGGPLHSTVVVSGLPRSGTSLLMQMLVAAGLPPHTDGARASDPDNPRGYFEHAAIRRLPRDPDAWRGARGHLVKVVVPLVDALPDDGPFHLLFAERAIDEVVASQDAMIARHQGGDASPTPPELREALAQASARSRDRLVARADVQLEVVSHARLLAAPQEVAERIAAFLAPVAALDPSPMAAAVDPTLHRQRGSLRAR